MMDSNDKMYIPFTHHTSSFSITDMIPSRISRPTPDIINDIDIHRAICDSIDSCLTQRDNQIMEDAIIANVLQDEEDSRFVDAIAELEEIEVKKARQVHADHEFAMKINDQIIEDANIAQLLQNEEVSNFVNNDRQVYKDYEFAMKINFDEQRSQKDYELAQKIAFE